MHEINIEWFKQLLAERRPPCVSIYMTTHRSAPPADENPVRFGNLVEKARQSLAEQYPRHAGELIDRIHGLIPGQGFWVGDRDALAFFVSPDYANVIELQRPVDELVIVGESFHVKPLIRILQTAGRFQILCLTQNTVEMYEGDRYRLEKLELRNIPTGTDIVSGMRLSKQVTSKTDLAEAPTQLPDEGTTAAAPQPVLEHYFRAVDKAVWENYSRDSRLPLVLCAVESHHPRFQQISNNQYLVKEGIGIDPKGISLERLREEAWKLIEPEYHAQLDRLKDQFRAAKAHRTGSDELMQVAEAAASGRVGTLLVDSDVRIPGRLYRASGLIQPAAAPDEQSEDLLDDLAEMVIKMDGRVLVVPHDLMPTESGLAAIYRY